MKELAAVVIKRIAAVVREWTKMMPEEAIEVRMIVERCAQQRQFSGRHSRRYHHCCNQGIN
jgi:hypothetical protein